MTWSKRAKAAGAAALLCLACQGAQAGPLRDRIMERRAERLRTGEEEGARQGAAALPAGTRVRRDVAYGPDEAQRFDVYSPAQARGAPVIFMVHGGGWRRGDKAMRSVVENKVARWVPKGFVVISTNYRLLPGADPVEQAKDVARAIAAAQAQAASWGGDPGKFVVMGHSAGAHLVALLASSPSLAAAVTTPWLGTVSLDSAALDVVPIMRGRHLRLYDPAFGDDPAFWRAASPYHALTAPGRPILLVCSTRRDDSCAQARRFAAKATTLGTRAPVLGEDLSHREINETLGAAGAYTDGVEAFMASLDGAVAAALGR